MQTRTPFVRVDAHINPYGAWTVFYETLQKIRRCHTGGQGRPPLQAFYGFADGTVQFCDCILSGRCGHRPLRTYCVVAIRCAILIVHSARAAQTTPLRYGEAQNNSETERT